MDLRGVIIGLSVAFMAWYIVGIQINRRRAARVQAWLKAGLEEEIGAVSEMRWLRPTRSAGALVVTEPFAPFRNVEAIFALEWVENLPVWLYRRLRGRRNELILRVDLRLNPAQEFEVGLLGSKGYENYLAEHTDEPMQRLEPLNGFAIARRGRFDEEQIEHLKQFLAANQGALLRLSLQRKTIHLMLRANLKPMQEAPAADFFAGLKSWL